jgi:hypothetical protein
MAVQTNLLVDLPPRSAIHFPLISTNIVAELSPPIVADAAIDHHRDARVIGIRAAQEIVYVSIRPAADDDEPLHEVSSAVLQ